MKPAFIFLIGTLTIQAQLAVQVLPVKVTGQKAVVPLVMKNNFGENIESARAAVFLLDESGKMIGQSVKWVIGGSLQTTIGDKPGMSAGATNIFHFVLTSDKPFATTNLIAKVTFSRVILEGGKLANIPKDLQISK